MMVRMSPTVADSLAEIRARSRLGIAIAAMMPMIATTMSNSISVKPSPRRPILVMSALTAECSRGGDGGPPSPPGLSEILLQCEAGASLDVGRDRAVRTRRRGAGVREAQNAARIAAEAADSRLPDVDRGGDVRVGADAARRRHGRDRGGRGPGYPRAGVSGLRLHARDLAIDERRAVGRVARDAAGRRVHEAVEVALVEAAVGRLIGGLGRDERADVTDGRRLVRGDPRPEQAGDRDRGDDADDRDDDQQLDQGETLLSFHNCSNLPSLTRPSPIDLADR